MLTSEDLLSILKDRTLGYSRRGYCQHRALGIVRKKYQRLRKLSLGLSPKRCLYSMLNRPR